MPSGLFDSWLETIHAEDVMELKSVRHAMNTDAVACPAGATVREALGLMFKHDVGFLPLVDQEKVVGVVTDRDLARAVHRTGAPPDTIPVMEEASAPVHVIRAQATIADALASMKERRVHRLPVVDDGGRLVGVVSIDDVARYLAVRATFEGAALTSAYARLAASPR